ncbi:hypothetical protein TELCIR_12446, partial [Teladorsagia circumcincta]
MSFSIAYEKQKLFLLSATVCSSCTEMTKFEDTADVTEPSNAKIDKKQLKKGMSEFKKALDSFGNQRKEIQQVFHGMVDETFSSVFDLIAEFVTGLSHSVNLFLERHDRFASHTNYIFYLCIIIPALLLALCVLAMFFLLIRGLFNCCVKDPDGGRRGLLSRFGGEIMGTTGYVAMLTTALLFIMSSNIFYKCKNNYSFFDALDGPRLLADNAMEDAYAVDMSPRCVDIMGMWNEIG